MRKMKALAILTLLGSTTFFSYGCTATQRKELLDEVKMYAAEELKNAVPKLAKVVDDKLAEAKKKKLVELDVQLAQLKMNDPETGEPIADTVKTWKSFDTNSDGDLDETEVAKAGAWVTRTLAERVATGKMSKEQAGNIGKSTGATLLALLLLGLGKRGTSAVVKKFSGGGGSPPTGGAAGAGGGGGGGAAAAAGGGGGT
jgi:hypothetical protein